MASSAAADGEGQRQKRCALAAFGQEIDRAGDAGVQKVCREAGDGMDAGLAGCQRCPIVGFALSKRGDNADAGDGDNAGGPNDR